MGSLGTSSGRHPRPSVPLAYAAAAVVAVAVVLPSSLRPPPDATTDSAEFAPDAPPDPDQTDAIVAVLRLPASTGGPASGGAGAARDGAGPGSVPAPLAGRETIVGRASRGACFGDPPRQVESLYAVACAPAFVGDNGGATYHNVTGDEVRVGMWESTSMPRTRGPVPTSPSADEGAAARTHRVLQDYWNRNFELYGRRLQLVALPNPGRGEPNKRASAVQADQDFHVFASTHLDPSFCDELARRHLVCSMGPPARQADQRARQPYWWSFQAAIEENEALMADFTCAQLAGRPAAFASGGEQGRTRVFGILVESSTDTGFRSAAALARMLRDECDVDAEAAELASPNDDGGATASEVSSTMARFRLAGVTTVLNYTTLLTLLPFQQAADANGWFPEWVVSGHYGIDFNDVGRLLPQGQMAHAFGLSGWEVPRPFPATECYRAYKTIDPTGEPDESVCRLFFHRVMQVVNGLQAAGPNLTPATFQAGLFEYGHRRPPEPWAMYGGYGPGDWAFMDSFGLIWWDPSAADPAGDEPGAYRWTMGGRRFAQGEIPTAPIAFFEEGITTT